MSKAKSKIMANSLAMPKASSKEYESKEYIYIYIYCIISYIYICVCVHNHIIIYICMCVYACSVGSSGGQDWLALLCLYCPFLINEIEAPVGLPCLLDQAYVSILD